MSRRLALWVILLLALLPPGYYAWCMYWHQALPAAGVTLPGAIAAPPITVTQQADGTVTIQHKPIGAAGLQAALDALTQGDRDRRIFVEADKQTAYGDLMGLMDRLREAGYLKIGLMGTVPQ